MWSVSKSAYVVARYRIYGWPATMPIIQNCQIIAKLPRGYVLGIADPENAIL